MDEEFKDWMKIFFMIWGFFLLPVLLIVGGLTNSLIESLIVMAILLPTTLYGQIVIYYIINRV